VPHRPLARPSPRRVQDDKVGLDRLLARLDAEHRAGVLDPLGERASEEPDAAVQVEGHVAPARHQALHHGLDQQVRGLQMDLPEAARALSSPAAPSSWPTPLAFLTVRSGSLAGCRLSAWDAGVDRC
jgi:hypothetical protein